MTTTVRRIRTGEVALFREVRLNALKTDPDSFESTYDREVKYSDATWEEWANGSAHGDAQFAALALGDDRTLGMVGGYRPPDAAETRSLYGMWVAPDARSSGIGSELVAVTIDWARESGAESVTLWVVTTNTPALSLYRKRGFIETGMTQPLPARPHLTEVQLGLAFT